MKKKSRRKRDRMFGRSYKGDREDYFSRSPDRQEIYGSERGLEYHSETHWEAPYRGKKEDYYDKSPTAKKNDKTKEGFFYTKEEPQSFYRAETKVKSGARARSTGEEDLRGGYRSRKGSWGEKSSLFGVVKEKKKSPDLERKLAKKHKKHVNRFSAKKKVKKAA